MSYLQNTHQRRKPITLSAGGLRGGVPQHFPGSLCIPSPRISTA